MGHEWYWSCESIESSKWNSEARATTSHSVDPKLTLALHDIKRTAYIFSIIIIIIKVIIIMMMMMRSMTLLCFLALLRLVSGLTSRVGSTTTTTTRRSFVQLSSSPEGVPEMKEPVKCPNCDKCDGSGRILGGIPLILPWWPIKPYRPCPNFINNGGIYTRAGQGLDEIAFGRDSTYPGK